MRLLLALLAVALAGCATPVAPTGGPADTTPPTLVASTPSAGATRVASPTLTLTFSERIDPASAARAVRVTPEAEGPPPRVSVRAQTLTVELPPLREATTYVVTLSTDLADTRGVRLRAPLTLAFATGDRLDEGRIEGAVRDPDTGRPVAGMAVWAYALPDTAAAGPAGLPDPRRRAPDYRTETAADGAFRLEYLREADFFVAAVADANRSGRADDGEAFAVPTRSRVRPAPTTATADSLVAPTGAPAGPLVLWRTEADTTAPAVQAVRAATDRRLVVRLSEPVVLRHARGWTAEDSLSGTVVALRPSRSSASEINLRADAPLPASGRLRLADATAAADSSGNALAPFTRPFTVAPTAATDTSAVRIVSWLPSAVPDSVRTLRAAEWPGARFSAAPDTSALSLVGADGAIVPSRIETTDGLALRLVPLSTSPPGTALTLRVALPGATDERRFRVLPRDEAGVIVGTVPPAPAVVPVVVEVRPEAGGPVLRIPADADGRFAVTGLPAGRYAVRAFADVDGNGRWSGGRLAPYVPPEPLARLAEPVVVRARWDAEVSLPAWENPPGVSAP